MIDKKKLISEYLLQLSAEQLAAEIMPLVEQDKAFFEQLCLKAQLALSPFNRKEVGKLITKALPNRHTWEQPKVAKYFSHAINMFSMLNHSIASQSPDIKLQVLEDFLNRFNVVMAKVDDSFGQRFALQEVVFNAFSQTFNQVDWPIQQQGEWLLKHYLSANDLTLPITSGFPLNEPQYQAFLQSCQRAFSDIEVSADIKLRNTNIVLNRLSKPLLKQASANRDVHSQVKILAKTAVSINDVLNICQLQLQQHDELSADDYLLKAKGLIANDIDKMIWLKHAINVALAEMDVAKACQYAWQAFELQPGFAEFLRLEKVVLKTGELGKRELEAIEHVFLQKSVPLNDKQPGNNSNALDFYLYVDQFDKAIAWASNHKVDRYKLLSLANKIQSTHCDIAVNFYCRVLQDILDQKTNSAYADAIEYLKEIAQHWPANLEHKKAFLSLLTTLVESNRKKRQFLDLISLNFAPYLR